MAQDEYRSWSPEDAAAFAELVLRHSKPYGVVLMSEDGRIRGWNRGAAHITGFEEADAVGEPFRFLFTPEDRERKLDEHELASAQLTGCAEDERWHLRKDGSSFWSSGMTLRLAGGHGHAAGFVKIFRDATHLRTRMRYLENFQQEQREHESHRDIFVATIAHEMRNPLAPMKTALSLLMHSDTSEARNRNALKIMDRQLGFLERLVEDLIDLTRVKRGQFRIDCTTVVLQDLLTDAMESCRGEAERRGVALKSVFPSVPIEVDADPGRLHQVVSNLLNNGIKFTPARGTVWLSATADQTHFLIVVRDNGVGITGDLLPQIFDVFTQATGADTQRGSGLGIGLSLVKEIVSLHHGTVEVRSEGEGRGAEFTVRIPLRSSPGLLPEPPEDSGGVD
jgi:PAS domain S-box-containing protein